MEKVEVSVDVSGLEEAMAKFSQVTGTASSSQRALAQFERTGELAVAKGGVVTPEEYERMTLSVDRMKRSYADITRQINEHRGALDAILNQYPKLRQEVERLAKFGLGPEALFSGQTAKGTGFAADDKLLATLFGIPEGEIGRLRSAIGGQAEIGKLTAQQERLQSGIAAAQPVIDMVQAQDRVWAKWIPQLGREIVRGTMAVIGIGSALSIIGESRRRAIDYDLKAAEIRGFLGSRAGDVNTMGKMASGDYDTYPMEALDVVRSAGAALRSGVGISTKDLIGKGVFFGLGRSGFARMGEESVGQGAFPDIAAFSHFGSMAGGLAQTYGLLPAQRQFFLESNKNLIEQMVIAGGGRPMSAEAYFSGVHSLMVAMHGLNLPMGGAPTALAAAGSAMQDLNPIGKSFSSMIVQGQMLGLRPDLSQGLYLGNQRAIAEMLGSPNAFLKSLQSMAQFVGITPGSQVNGGQLDALMAVLQTHAPGVFKALGTLNTAGVNIGDLINQQPGALPADLEAKMKSALQDTEAAIRDGWRQQDIQKHLNEINGIGKWTKGADEKVQEILNKFGVYGPAVGAIGSSALGVLGPAALGYLGARAGAQAVAGAAAGAGLGALASGALLPVILAGSGILVGYAIGDTIHNRPSEGAQAGARIGAQILRQGAIRGGAENPDPYTTPTSIDPLIESIKVLLGKMGDLMGLIGEAEMRRSQNVLPERRYYRSVPGLPNR